MDGFASSGGKNRPKPIVPQSAMSSAGPHPLGPAIDAVTPEETTPPRLPIVFISAESEAEYRGAKSIQEAQKFAAANILNPAASAIMGSATTVTVRWLPL